MSILSSLLRPAANLGAIIPGPQQPFAMAYQTANAVQDQQKMQKDYKHQMLVQQQKGNAMEFNDTNFLNNGSTNRFISAVSFVIF